MRTARSLRRLCNQPLLMQRVALCHLVDLLGDLSGDYKSGMDIDDIDFLCLTYCFYIFILSIHSVNLVMKLC